MNNLNDPNNQQKNLSDNSYHKAHPDNKSWGHGIAPEPDTSSNPSSIHVQPPYPGYLPSQQPIYNHELTRVPNHEISNFHSTLPHASISNAGLHPNRSMPQYYQYQNTPAPAPIIQQYAVAPPQMPMEVLPRHNNDIPPTSASSSAAPSILPPQIPPASPPSNPSLAAQMIAQYPSIPRSAFTLDGPPLGVKPRVTTTLWEDEGTLCFQVEARNVCVARRKDNNMINGTKLLNVAGMTRGRRDGILKTEKVRCVIKVGAMHFKGVWIPYERALVLAGKEEIVDILYPLFVADIKALLYHPNNYSRTALVMAAADRKRQENQNEAQKKQEMLRRQQDQQFFIQQPPNNPPYYPNP